MLRRKHSEQGEDIPHNKVFSLWSPDEVYELCNKAARKACKKYDYPGESKDIAHELWIYLRERGHIVKCPEHKGAIYNFLTKCVRDNLRRRWNYDKSHTSIDCNDSEAFELPIDLETAEKILEEVAEGELLARILRQARGDQIEIIKSLLAGTTQVEIAKSRGLKQYQISRWLTALRQRIR